MDSFKDIAAGLKIEKRSAIRLVTSDYGVCTICKGAGYTCMSVPYGHPQFGKAQMCECRKAERKARQQQALLDQSGIMGLKRFQDATFSTFVQLDSCKPAYRAALTYAANPSGWLLMLGPCGSGKTHLAVSIAKQRVEAGDTVLVQTVPDLLDQLRSTFSSHAEQRYDERLEQMKRVDLLVLDDYGAEKETNWATEKLFQLLNHRYNTGASTVITSNNMILEGIDARIRSRLQDRELVSLVRMEETRDYRRYGDGEE